MFVQEIGSAGKTCILFLHANGASWKMWKPHMEALSGDYHCLAPDFPGYGGSNRQEWVSLEETADQVAEILRQRAAQGKAHVVGLSLGGSTLIALLSRHPQVVDHAIVDGAGVLPIPGFALQKVGFHLMQPFMHREFVIRLLASAMKLPPEEHAEFRQGMLAMSPASFTRSFLQALSQREPQGLRAFAGQVLFVAGEKEPQAVRESNRMLASALPNAACRVAPGMAHGWLAENPQLHLRMVRAWLSDQPLPVELVVP